MGKAEKNLSGNIFISWEMVESSLAEAKRGWSQNRP